MLSILVSKMMMTVQTVNMSTALASSRDSHPQESLINKKMKVRFGSKSRSESPNQTTSTSKTLASNDAMPSFILMLETFDASSVTTQRFLSWLGDCKSALVSA